MPQKINELLTKLNEELKNSAVCLYMVQIDNLPMLVLAYGHKKADEIISSLCKKINGYRPMSDQIFIVDGESDSKKFSRHIKDIIHQSDTHIASTLSHIQFPKGTKGEDALAEIYSRALRDNTVFSANKNESTSQTEESRGAIELANQIKTFIREQKFKLAYQPIIEAKTGDISHYEALLRIEDADGNLKSAGSFIPIAEKLGLIDSIDLYVLDMVITKLKESPELKIALNISNLTIGNREWLKKFFDSITPEIGRRIVIEITETTALRDLRETAYFIATLQDAGCMFSLDDFGSGYTSFRQIRALSFDFVKIDGSLINDIATNPHNRLLVKSLLEYMSGLGIKTVAEFVETGETAKILMDFGIDYMQGNYFGPAAKLS